MLTVVPILMAIMSSLAFCERPLMTSLRASFMPWLVSEVVGIFAEPSMLSMGLVSLKDKSIATASVLVPPRKIRC